MNYIIKIIFLYVLQLRETSSSVYMDEHKEVTVQLEWIESLLLFQATYHKYDDVTRMQNFQMRLVNIKLFVIFLS